MLTATFHDRHHENPNVNMSGFFTWWDTLMGTADKDWRTKYAAWRRTGRTGTTDKQH
jgi:sterol desaturase/sphingolipid hydroxylase (fatty acid hydroxylase superfamily)